MYDGRNILVWFRSPTVSGGPKSVRMFTELGICRSRWVAAAALFGVLFSAVMLNNPLARGQGLYPWGMLISHGFMLLGIFMMLASHGRWRVKAAQWYQFACASFIVTGSSLLLGFYSLNPYHIPGLVLAMIGTTSVIAVPTRQLISLIIISWVVTAIGVAIAGVDNAVNLVEQLAAVRNVEADTSSQPQLQGEKVLFIKSSRWLAFALIYTTAQLVPTCAGSLGVAVNVWYKRNYGARRRAQLDLKREKRRAENLQRMAEDAKRWADILLDRALTKPVADIIRRKEEFPPELQEVCVIACDIENFSIACQRMPSQIMVDALQRFFTLFDKCCAESTVEPLRSQGDSRLALAGLFPQPGKKKRRPAIDAVLAMVRFRNRLQSGELKYIWSVRIGIHIGAVRAGVMDGARICFDVWGETVNIAARLEQAGRREGAERSNRILVSENVLWGLCGLFEHGPMSEIVVKDTIIANAAEVFDISALYRNEVGEPTDTFWRVYEDDDTVPKPPREFRPQVP